MFSINFETLGDGRSGRKPATGRATIAIAGIPVARFWQKAVTPIDGRRCGSTEYGVTVVKDVWQRYERFVFPPGTEQFL